MTIDEEINYNFVRKWLEENKSSIPKEGIPKIIELLTEILSGVKEQNTTLDNIYERLGHL